MQNYDVEVALLKGGSCSTSIGMKWNNFYICELPCEVYDQNKIRRVERSHVTSIKFFFFWLWENKNYSMEPWA
jgi:hypothetical protein